MESIIREQATGSGNDALAQNVMSAEEFGRRVVKDVVGGRMFGGKTGKTYTGTLGWSAKYIVWWWPAWLFVSSLPFSINRKERGMLTKENRISFAEMEDR